MVAVQYRLAVVALRLVAVESRLVAVQYKLAVVAHRLVAVEPYRLVVTYLRTLPTVG